MFLAEVVAGSEEGFARVLFLLCIAGCVLTVVMVYLAVNAVMRFIHAFVSLLTTTPSVDQYCPQCGEHDPISPPKFGLIGHRQTDRICSHCRLRFAPPIALAKTAVGLILGGVFVAAAIVGYYRFSSIQVDFRVLNILLADSALLGMSLLFSHLLDLTRSIAVNRSLGTFDGRT